MISVPWETRIAFFTFFNLIMVASLFAVAKIDFFLFLISMLFAVLLSISPLRSWAIPTTKESEEVTQNNNSNNDNNNNNIEEL